MRFFRVTVTDHPSLWGAVRAALGQPNPSAQAPWGENGDFEKEGWIYVAFGPYHASRFSGMIDQFISASGVEEITESQYREAMPVAEEGEPI